MRFFVLRYTRDMQHSRLLTWSQHFYIVGLVLALVFIIPAAWFPFQLAKVALFGVSLLVSTVLFVWGGGLRTLASKSGIKTVLLVALLPLAYLVSWYFSVSRSIGLLGFSVEADTIVFVTLASLALLCSFMLFRSAWSARVLLVSVGFVAAVAAFFQYVVIIFGTAALPLQAFADRSFNLVGKWNDLGLLVGLALLLLLVWVEFFDISPLRRLALGFAGLLMLLLLVIIQFSLVWSLLLGFCLLLAVWSFLVKQKEAAQPLPWLPLAGAAVAGAMLLWGSILGGGLTSVFPVSSLEVRPAFSSTLDVVRASHGASVERFFVGTGPETFGQEWILHKPAGVNQSQFWNLDFNIGFSTFITALASVGVLGVLAWLVPFMLVLLAVLRIVRGTLFTAKEKLLGLALAISAVYLWCTIFLYVPSENMILLAFTFAGAAYGFSMRHQHHAREDAPASGRLTRLFGGIGALLLVVLVFSVSFVVARRSVAEGYTNQGFTALAQNKADQALAAAANAQRIETTGNNLLLAVAAGQLTLQQMSSGTTQPTKEMQVAFAEQLQSTVSVAQRYIKLYPDDYRGYLGLANTYSLLVPLGVQGAYENGKQVYEAAALHNPTNPALPLALARLEVLNKNNKGAEAYLLQSLTLKPDYTDAILLVVQINVTNNDLPSAIRAAQAAVQSAPGVASIWFELGLLYYTNKNTKDAVAPLEQAVTLQPQYANAKYFLGLSYAAEGSTQDAVEQFVDLQKTNPDNTEVASILYNLKQGKKPFDGAQPPVTVAPQNRSTAPISQ